MTVFLHSFAFFAGTAESALSTCDRSDAIDRRILLASLLPDPRSISNESRDSVGTFFISGQDVELTRPRMLPFSLGSSVLSAGAGFVVTYMNEYRVVLWVSFVNILLPHSP
jgi:hypothetical protein